jgi:hypothetical protein
MQRKKQTAIEKFLSLSDHDRAAEVARLDAMPGRALTTAQRKRWSSIQRKLKRGRPTIGRGSKIVPVTIERGLLEQADEFARAHKLKRSQMVAEGLRLVMSGRAKAG